jgi:nicotinamidase-related amidase
METHMKKTLFLIIDMQNGFINRNTEGIDNRILKFLDRIRDRVIAAGTRYVNHEHTACYIFEGWKACMAGTKEAEVIPTLRPFMARVFDKDKYSCWNDEMKAFIRDNEIEKVYFAGVNTGCCVLHSAFDFYNDLVDCSVIEDLCGSTSGVREHEAALIVLRSCITDRRVITAEQAVREILDTDENGIRAGFEV